MKYAQIFLMYHSYIGAKLPEIEPWGPYFVGNMAWRARPAREGGGGKIPGAQTGLGARNLDKTSGHCATVKRVGA